MDHSVSREADRRSAGKEISCFFFLNKLVTLLTKASSLSVAWLNRTLTFKLTYHIREIWCSINHKVLEICALRFPTNFSLIIQFIYATRGQPG
jgi:hypothetical protein